CWCGPSTGFATRSAFTATRSPTASLPPPSRAASSRSLRPAADLRHYPGVSADLSSTSTIAWFLRQSNLGESLPRMSSYLEPGTDKGRWNGNEQPPMVIVAGHITVEPQQRESYL